jgi:hypothetical protein
MRLGSIFPDFGGWGGGGVWLGGRRGLCGAGSGLANNCQVIRLRFSETKKSAAGEGCARLR